MVNAIALKPKCSETDLDEFSKHLKQLIGSCDYDVNAGGDSDMAPLLFRSVHVHVCMCIQIDLQSCMCTSN